MAAHRFTIEYYIYTTPKIIAIDNDTTTFTSQWLLAHRPFSAIGIATFGPIDAKKSSRTYGEQLGYFLITPLHIHVEVISRSGYITSTPKPGWKNTDVLSLLDVQDFGVPYAFDTDVNAPALAEFKLRNHSMYSSSAYITVGTGIGVGLVINGRTVHGLVSCQIKNRRAINDVSIHSFIPKPAMSKFVNVKEIPL